MINDIITGTCNKLKEAFGEGYGIYAENQPQGFREPCFFITCVNCVERPVSGTRRSRMYSVSVSVGYRPESKTGPLAECHDISDGLFNALLFIAVGDEQITGTNMSSDFGEGMLEFTVVYDVIVETDNESEMMGELFATLGKNKIIKEIV